MATRSNICVKVDNMYRTVYCHRNGQPSYNGQMLLNYYNSQQKAEELISLGHISSIGRQTEKPVGNPFDLILGGFTFYFGRDEGNGEISYTVSSFRPRLEEMYLYVFEDGKWHVEGEHIHYQELTKKLVNNYDPDDYYNGHNNHDKYYQDSDYAD